MDLSVLKSFFMWCTIINAGLGFLVFLVYALAGDLIYRSHSRLFPISRETFYTVGYSFMGIFKLLIFVFNLVPFIALSIVG